MERCTIRDNDGMAYLKAEYDTADTIDAAIEKLAEYEDAEESGSWIKLPAPIGTTVYIPLMDCDEFPNNEGCKLFVDMGFNCNNCSHYAPKIITEPFNVLMLNDDGNLITGCYLNKEEAEKTLKELANAREEEKSHDGE